MSTFPKSLTMALAWVGISGSLMAGAPAQLPPGAKELETARQRFAREDYDGALKILQRLPKDVDSLLERRARLGRALAWADADAGRRRERDAAREFEELASGPQDITAGSARIARAAIAWRQKQPEEARRWIREGLAAWRSIQESQAAPVKGSLEEEVLAIRNTQFRSGNSGPRPSNPFPYRLAPSRTRVDLRNEPPQDVTVTRSLLNAPDVLFVNEEQEAFLKTLLSRFRAERDAFRSNEAPSGARPPQILEFINESISVGYRLEGSIKHLVFEWDVLGVPPISIRFQDELRTRVEVCSEDPRNGSCAFYEKRDGVWVFVQAGSLWAV